MSLATTKKDPLDLFLEGSAAYVALCKHLSGDHRYIIPDQGERYTDRSIFFDVDYQEARREPQRFRFWVVLHEGGRISIHEYS